MSKIVILGGAGAVGSVASRTLAKHDEFSEVIIADNNITAAHKLCSEISSSKVSAISFNAHDRTSLNHALEGCNLVLNCVGPFFNTVKPILDAVHDARINYVDICDDVDTTLEILKMSDAVKESGLKFLVGMGISPGATNIIGRYIAENLLDETDSIDIYHAHGGEPIEGEGVIGHRFHCMSIDIPLFLDGELRYVKFFEEDGIAQRQTFNFPILGDVFLYPYPHPEQVTMPRYLKLRQVTNKGSVLPPAYYDLIKDCCRLGLNSNLAIDVKGIPVIPYDFAVSYILQQREKILKETGFGRQRGCCSVVAKGKRHGKYKEYRFHMASKSQALGEGTGIPAAMGAILMNRGKVNGHGVMPPEACIEPGAFLGLMPEVMEWGVKKTEGESFSGYIVESVDELGNVTRMELP